MQPNAELQLKTIRWLVKFFTIRGNERISGPLRINAAINNSASNKKEWQQLKF
jgi:hypothetical protein